MVKLIVENETDEAVSEQQIEEIKRVCETVMEGEDCNFDAEISLTFTDNAGIREINREYRDIDKPTDVLSFPMIDFSVISSFEDLDGMPDVFHPDTGEAMLGDIVINCERVLSQALEYGHSVRREYAFLIAHSMLHLLGYDHMDEDERSIMEDRQRVILDDLGITRED